MPLGPLQLELESLQIEYEYTKLMYDRSLWYYHLVSNYSCNKRTIEEAEQHLSQRQEAKKKAYRALVKISV